MNSPLDRLLEGTAVAVTADSLDGFLKTSGPAVLIFTGDPAQRPEAQDVAVVGRELARQVKGLTVGVVSGAAEEAVKPRFNVSVVPTVLFLQDGHVKSTVAKLQDWAVYARTAHLLFGKHKEAAS